MMFARAWEPSLYIMGTFPLYKLLEATGFNPWYFTLELHEEALRRAEELKAIDADDPYLLNMIARVYEAQGRQSEATAYAREAVQKAELEDPLNRESYEEYLRHLLTFNDGQEFTPSAV